MFLPRRRNIIVQYFILLLGCNEKTFWRLHTACVVTVIILCLK